MFFYVQDQARSQDFGGEGARIWVPAPKEGPGFTPGTIWKTYMRFGAIYYICCTKIINLANLKVMFFSAFIRKNSIITGIVFKLDM